MLREINNIFQKISQLRSEIDQIKNLPSRMAGTFPQRSRPSEPVQQSRFSSTLQEKLPSGELDIDRVITEASHQEDMEEELIRAVIQIESGFDPEAVSHRGARGLMQLMPGTAAELGVDPDNPAENIMGGTRYLSSMLHRFGNLEEALAAYNAGPRNVETYQGIPPFRETENYVKQVLDRYRKLKEDAALPGEQ